MAKSVMEQLLKDGKVRRGMLGVNIQNVTEELAKSLDLEQRSGVIVSNVRQGSAADKAGMKRNDLILAINGEKIEDSNTLRNKVAGTIPGVTIKLTVLRDGKEVALDVTLDEFDTENARRPRGSDGDPDTPGPKNQSGKLGLSLEPVTPATAKQLSLDSDKEGMIVTEVDPSGPAGEEGVNRGDCILEINKKPVNSISDVQAALAASGDRPVLLLISRRGQTIYLTVKPQ